MADETDQTPDDTAASPPDDAVSVAPFIDDDEEETDAVATEDQETGSGADAAEPDTADGAAADKAGGAKTGEVKKTKKVPAKATGSAKDGASAGATVTRRTVTSKRVTPKGGGTQTPSGPKKAKAKAHDHDDVEASTRYTPPGTYTQGPSPWWVPTLLFGLLIIGSLIIMLNYVQAFGDPSNIYLVIGLVFILGGIITATQYR